MADLKPCPCCGGVAEEWPHISGGYKVRCKICGLQTRLFRLQEFANEAWNRLDGGKENG